MKKCILSCVALFAVSSPALATPLPPGTSVVPGLQAGTFASLATTGPLAFALADGTAGTVQESVGHFAGNPFGVSNITFIYQVAVTAGDVGRLSGFNFAGWSIDVGQEKSGGLLGTGTRAAITADLSSDGKVVGFNFPQAINPGDLSFVLIVNTDAPSFTKGLLSVIDGGTLTRVGFAPAKGVPEPASLTIAGIFSLCFGAGWLRKRRLAA